MISTTIEKSDPVNAPVRPYRLAARASHPDDTVITIGDVRVGGGEVTLMAGPCAVENLEQLLDTALAVKASGGHILRGGAFKPRTSPYDFQGLGEEALEMLAEAREITGLPVVTEVMDSEDVDMVAAYADILQIGARNMTSARLLMRAARTGKPILLKRGFAASVREWLLSAEYILAQGNSQVILCERGIRTHDSEYTRNTLDLNVVPLLKQETHLPVIVDPSHGTGRADLVVPMSRGALAVGADGLIIEVHPDPEHARCDGPQSLSLTQFARLANEVRSFTAALCRAA
jgi:3-deoxy-7-phosphoheptulonate synthase